MITAVRFKSVYLNSSNIMTVVFIKYYLLHVLALQHAHHIQVSLKQLSYFMG